MKLDTVITQLLEHFHLFRERNAVSDGWTERIGAFMNVPRTEREPVLCLHIILLVCDLLG